MGGEITWECIKDPATPDVGKYIFKMKVYRDCDGSPLAASSKVLDVWGHPTVTQIILNWVESNDITPDGNSTTSGNACLDCPSGSLGAVEELIFESNPTALFGTPPVGGWHFTWDICCRNGAISNLV